MIEHIDADTLAVRIAAWKTLVIDVRGAHALQAGRIPEAILIPQNELSTSLRGLPLETSLTLLCETAEQSALAALALWNYGFHKIAVLKGGFAAWPVHTP